VFITEKTMQTLPFTVLLMRPDYLAEQYGTDTYLAQVDAAHREGAIKAAQIQAHGNDQLTEECEPEDYAAVLVLPGHHSAVPEDPQPQAPTDTKGRLLIAGAWYAVWNGFYGDSHLSQLAQWTGERFVDEGGREYVNPDYALLQQCIAASAAGVTP
jgi:hypothetical protein